MTTKTVSVVLNAIVGPYNAAMAQAAGTTKAFGTHAATAGQGAKQMAGQVGLLNPALIGGAGLVVGLSKSVSAAIEWESAFAGVRKTVDGTEAEFAALSGSLREMGRDMGISAVELAGVAEAAGQLGIETQNIAGFTETMAMLGETTNLSADQAATQLARLANITQLPQNEFDRLGSVIVDLGNNMATTEAEIVEFGLRIAGAGTQVGMTEGEILAFGAALSSVGINAEAGGTAISKVMIDIASEVENSGDKLATFARVAGMSAGQFAEAWRNDASAALVTFITGLGNMEASGQSTLSVLEELGITEQRMRDALLRSSGASDVLTDALGRQGTALDENAALVEEFGKRMDTTEKQLDRAKESVVDIAREIGEGLIPALKEGAEGMADFLNLEGRGGVSLGQAFGQSVLIPMQANFKLLGAVIEESGIGPLAKWALGIQEAERNYSSFTAEQQHALGVLSEHKRILPEVADGTDDLGRALHDVTAETADLTDAQEALSAALAGFVDPLGIYTDAVREVATTTADATATSKDSWEDYAASADVSLSKFADSLQDQVSDLHAWEDNLVTVAERSSAEFAMQLTELGPEAAGLVRQLAEATSPELRRVAALFAENAVLTANGYTLSLEERLADSAGVADTAARRAVAALNVAEDMYDAGVLSADGWVRGILSQSGAMAEQAAYAGRRASEAARNAVSDRSPGDVFAELDLEAAYGADDEEPQLVGSAA